VSSESQEKKSKALQEHRWGEEKKRGPLSLRDCSSEWGKKPFTKRDLQRENEGAAYESEVFRLTNL